MKLTPLWTLLALVTIAAPAPAAPAPLTLSLLEPAGKGCTWYKRDLKANKAQVLATFPGHPRGARVAWRADQRRALVWFDPDTVEYLKEQPETGGAGAKPRLYQVALDRPGSAPVALTLPPAGKLQDLGFNTRGEAVALTMTVSDKEASRDSQGRAYFDYGGRRYTGSKDLEGMPVLVHAWVLGPKENWNRRETVVSDDGWDYAQGVRRLKASEGLQYRTGEALEAHPATTELKDKAVRKALLKLAPTLKPVDNDDWARLKDPAVPLYVWMVTGEFTYSTGRVAFGVGPNAEWAPRLPWASRDLAAIQHRAGHLLVAGAAAGGHPRVYDVKSRKLVFASDTARATVFWPE